MTSLYKQINFIVIATVVTTAISLVACTEEAAENKQTEIIVSPVLTEDKIAQLQREAQAGDPDAQYNLAYLYENGLGVPKDETKALELYQQAADQGHPAAQNNLDAMSASK
jgi:TPR repeat protein